MRVNDSHRLISDDGTAVPFVSTPNKSGKLVGGKPKFVIIHYTAGGSARSAVNTLKNPARKASAHFVLGHDGEITQMAKLDEKCWHAGRSQWKGTVGLNSHSVGIEIVNWGWLTGGAGNWKSHVGVRVDDSRVIEATHKNGGRHLGWEIYDPAQFGTCVDMVGAIAEKYNIPRSNVLGHDDISPRRKQDPGPAWPTEKFLDLVYGRDEDGGDDDVLYHVESGSGLNMRKGPGTNFDVVKLLANGASVTQVETQGAWWLVSEVVGGSPDSTGWVHSHWLRSA
ncbi:MAG: SH3 domain-containing protein [Rhodobacteraceae bacterium]|nr:SH3 domain-containing protein [Paracoccaceae bacterium]